MTKLRLPSGRVAFLDAPFEQEPSKQELVALEVFASAVSQVSKPDGSYNRQEAEARAVVLFDMAKANPDLIEPVLTGNNLPPYTPAPKEDDFTCSSCEEGNHQRCRGGRCTCNCH